MESGNKKAGLGLIKTIMVFWGVGIGVPILVTMVSSLIIRSPSWVGGIVLFFWPSSILFLGFAGNEGYFTLQFVQVLSLSLVINVFYYSVLAVLFWLGAKVHKTLAFITPLFMLWVWHQVGSL